MRPLFSGPPGREATTPCPAAIKILVSMLNVTFSALIALAAGVLAHADGASPAGSVLVGGTAFGGTLALAFGVVAAFVHAPPGGAPPVLPCFVTPGHSGATMDIGSTHARVQPDILYRFDQFEEWRVSTRRRARAVNDDHMTQRSPARSAAPGLPRARRVDPMTPTDVVALVALLVLLALVLVLAPRKRQ